MQTAINVRSAKVLINLREQVLLDKLIVPQLVKKTPHLLSIQQFIAVSTKFYHSQNLITLDNVTILVSNLRLLAANNSTFLTPNLTT